MARRALAFADVLRDELQWVRPVDRSAGERWCAGDWDFRPPDIYEPVTFLAKIERSRRCVGTDTKPDRYVILARSVHSADYPKVSDQVAARRLSTALTELVEELRLCEFLLNYSDFQRKVDGSPRLLHLILTHPSLRTQYFEGDGGTERLAALLDDRGRLAQALDDGDAIADLLWHSDATDAVRAQPQLLGAIIDSPALREALAASGKRAALKNVKCSTPCDPAEVLAAIDPDGPPHPVQPAVEDGAEYRANALLLESAFDAHLHDHRDESAMLERFNGERLVALCLSGGGIRSATFNLGVLQGLARRNILPRIDYLSTVSGGGYIGSWLSSWIRRHVDGTDGVNRDMAATSVDPLDPEPGPVGHLREYSNYLAPRPSLFGPDLWSIFATYARNLLLNWTMLLPPLIVLLIVPRLYETWILFGREHLAHLWIGRLSLLGAMGVLAYIRPAGEYVPGKMDSIRDMRRRRKKILWFVLLVGIAALFLTAAWAIRGRVSTTEALDVFTRSLVLFGVANVIGSIIYLVRYYRLLRHSDHEQLNKLDRRKGFEWLVRTFLTRVGVPKVVLELVAAAAASLAGAGLVYLGARLVPAREIHAEGVWAITTPEIYTIGALPLFLIVLFVQSTLLVGIVTVVSGELEREWWARAAAIMLLAGVFWLLLGFLAIVGPAILTQSPKIIAALGGAAGVIALVRGHGDETKLKERQPEWKGRMLTIAAMFALVVIVSAMSLLVSKVLTGLAPADERKLEKVTAEADLWLVPPGYTLRPQKPPPSKTDIILSPTIQTERHIKTLRSGEWLILLRVFGVILLIAVVAALLFDVNTYSMHGMYRNRLIRAYLGASRWFRRPEPFTGFDPQDDLVMAQLRPEFLWSTSFHDLDGFLTEIHRDKPPVYRQFPKRVQNRIRDFLKVTGRATRDKLRNEITTVVFGSLNQMMRGTDLATGRAAPPTIETLRRNRQYLEDAYPAFIRRRSQSTPMHVINIALNLVRGDNLAWQDRKAESFTVSPLHSGAAVDRVGYRDSAEYGGPRGISLGTAMAISGAAVSSNMGYNSSSTVTALLTLFNARLGWWLGNPSRSSYSYAGPRYALSPLIDEALGNTNDESKYVFLSDGGHFENLGMYEMVRRRCRLIIVSDVAADPEYRFGDLANAVRKIRIDLGIPIEFTTFSLGPDPDKPDDTRVTAYCAVGEIRYKAAGSPGHFIKNGWLIYIKPVVHGDYPIDVVNYSKEGKPFPQESTADQFFSETQFESYRELGAHIIRRLATNDYEHLPRGLRRLIRKALSKPPSATRRTSRPRAPRTSAGGSTPPQTPASGADPAD